MIPFVLKTKLCCGMYRVLHKPQVNVGRYVYVAAPFIEPLSLVLHCCNLAPNASVLASFKTTCCCLSTVYKSSIQMLCVVIYLDPYLQSSCACFLCHPN